MLCPFLLYNNVTQPYVYIYPLPVEPPSPHSTPLGHHGVSGWPPCVIQKLPAILHMVLYIFKDGMANPFPSPPFRVN